ncbi:DUF488 domain-containing protein [Anaerolineales bacterium HSG25]|nr:DUF488 domain-containing protein [Anaerolineales bacterium HSG25]
MYPKFFTIGVYGSTEDSFFKALTDTGIDMFCDIRLRRGMRGKKYAYVNSTYLQAKLEQLTIGYVHHKELAPSKAIREQQKEADKRDKIAKRDRQQLGDVFVQAYEKEILVDFEVETFANSFAKSQKVVLFCVERDPSACHRSLLAKKLSQNLGITVEHIIP